MKTNNWRWKFPLIILSLAIFHIHTSRLVLELFLSNFIKSLIGDCTGLYMGEVLENLNIEAM